MKGGSSRGFTLIELLVAMALASILVGVTSFIFINAKKLYDQSLQEIATATELRSGFERLGRDLHDVQPAVKAGWELMFRDVDGADGPEDEMEYVTLERTETTATPIRVLVKLGPKDADGLAPLVRTVTHRGVDTAGNLKPAGESVELVQRVRTLRLEYAWPSQGVPEATFEPPTPAGTNAGHVFLRGAGLGPWAGPSAASGKRFLYENTTGGTISKNVLTMAGAGYDGTRLLPRRLADRVHVKYTATPSEVHVFPVIDVTAADKLTLAGAFDGPVSAFHVLLLPPAVQVTFKHEGRNGPRSVTEVLKLSP